MIQTSYRGLSCSWLALSLCMVPVPHGTAATTLPSDSPRVETDPMMAAVATPQPMVDPLSDAEYQRQSAAVLQAVGPATAPADAPVAAARVSVVEPDLPAAQAGLRVDDVLVAIDGQPVTSAESAYAAHRRASAAQTFDVIPFDQLEHKLLKLEPGRLGLYLQDVPLLEGEYLHSLAAGTAPLDSMRVAALNAVCNPPLAESALIRSHQLGVGNPLAEEIAAIALFHDNWLEDALSHAVIADKGLPQRQSELNSLIVKSAIATFRLPLAQAIAKNDRAYDAMLDSVELAFADYGGRPHLVAEPNPTASAVTFEARTDQVFNDAEDYNGNRQSSEYLTWFLKNKHTIPFKSPDGTYNVLVCGPAAGNVDFSADCHFAASDAGQSGFVKVVRLGVASSRQTIKTLELFLDGKAQIADKAGAGGWLNVSRLIDHDRTFHIRMCVVGERYEFTIDGRRIFYGPMPIHPLPADRSLQLSIQTVGVTGEFSKVSWSTADAK